MFTKQGLVLVEIEAVSGTMETPTVGDNAVMGFDISIEPKPDMKERYPANEDRSAFANIRGKTMVDMKITIELKGSGSAGSAPRWAPLLKACDRLETINAGTDVAYTPAVSSETCTIWMNIDGILHKMAGCAGEVEIDLVGGEVGKMIFTMSGVYVLATDVVITSPTFDSTIPPVIKGTTTTIGSYAAIIEKLNLKAGNQVVERTDFNQAEAILAFIVANRLPTFAMTIEAVLRATSNADFWSYFDTGATKALSLVLGATAGNIITIDAPALTFDSPKYGDRSGLVTMELTGQCARSSGNDEFTITLT